MARPLPTLDALLEGLARGDRATIGRAVTLVESTRPEHRELADTLLEALGEPPRPTLRIGVTGVPGVGKSTFIDAWGLALIARGHRVGVLAVDPSSARTGGSILGDKTRMGRLSACPEAFIRPSPTGGTLGGVAARTREAVRILEGAGFDRILIETVGVGQSETAVANMCDLFMLLALPGAGDELQGIKRGIMEMADLVVVTKADGDQAALAGRARAQLSGALRMLHGHGGAPEVMAVSALEGAGLEGVAETCEAMAAARTADGSLGARRRRQNTHWLWALVDEALRRRVHERGGADVAAIVANVEAGRMSVARGARAILALG
jgi:LAO/AO transport system kinase